MAEYTNKQDYMNFVSTFTNDPKLISGFGWLYNVESDPQLWNMFCMSKDRTIEGFYCPQQVENIPTRGRIPLPLDTTIAKELGVMHKEGRAKSLAYSLVNPKNQYRFLSIPYRGTMDDTVIGIFIENAIQFKSVISGKPVEITLGYEIPPKYLADLFRSTYDSHQDEISTKGYRYEIHVDTTQIIEDYTKYPLDKILSLIDETPVKRGEKLRIYIEVE